MLIPTKPKLECNPLLTPHSKHVYISLLSKNGWGKISLIGGIATNLKPWLVCQKQGIRGGGGDAPEWVIACLVECMGQTKNEWDHGKHWHYVCTQNQLVENVCQVTGLVRGSIDEFWADTSHTSICYYTSCFDKGYFFLPNVMMRKKMWGSLFCH